MAAKLPLAANFESEGDGMGDDMSSEFAIIGTRQPKIDAFEKVSGRAKFASDISLPGMLHLKILSSPHPHARVVSIDTSKALALPGVKAVLTYKDVPSFQWHTGMSILTGVPRFVGDNIAVVAAVSEEIAAEARDLIEVEYKILPFVLDPEEAMKPDAPKVAPEGNLLDGKPQIVSRGDIAKGFAEADLVWEGRYRTPMLQHATGEPRIAVAQWEGGKLTVWASVHGVFEVQKGLSKALKIPMSKIRVVCEFMGGAFGDRSTLERTEALAALVARKTERPARLELEREECYLAGHHRYPTIIDLKYGVKKDGTLTAMHCKVIGDMGGYFHLHGAAGVMETLQILYRCPNMKGESYSVLTNKPEGGNMRCIGHPMATFAQEVHMDMIAEKLGMDPVELRRKNHARLEDGDQFRKVPFSSNGMRECIERGAEAIGWKQRWQQKPVSTAGPIKRGVGMAIHACRHGGFMVGQPCSGMVRINQDGTVNVLTGAVDVGGGQKTTMGMIAAEELGVPFSSIFVTSADTDVTTDTGTTTASRQTMMGGNGARRAAADAKSQLLDLAAAELKADKKELSIRQGMIYKRGEEKGIPIGQITGKEPNPIIGRAVAKAPTNVIFHNFAANFVEVEVDTRTGMVKIVKIVAAHDLGRVINLLTAENQFDGGLTQGVAFALGERQIIDRGSGISLNPNHLDYKISTIKDFPQNIVPIMVESVDPYGPFGAKGVAEPVYAVIAPAISNAIYNAIGVRFTELPISPRAILTSLKSAKAGVPSAPVAGELGWKG
jgi:CO/xanthine dehydrogenase Mo-binding subunit